MSPEQERDDPETEALVGRLRAMPLVQPRFELRARVLDAAPPSLRQVFGWVAALAASIILSCILLPPYRAETPTAIRIGQVVLKVPVARSPWEAFRNRYEHLKRGC